MTTAGVLVAEGDSWFDYPLHDILRVLEDDYHYDVRSVAHKGDPLESMAYDKGQLEELTRTLEKLLAANQVPAAILLSGGGDDMAGDEFGMLLNHADSKIEGWNEDILRGLIDVRIKAAYVTVIEAVTKVCRDRTKQVIPIVIHGYDYAVADGRGFLGGWGPLPGPWLQPGFREKGYPDSALQTRIDLIVQLIDRFHDMQQSLLQVFARPGYEVRHVDLRNTLSHSISNYRHWWANEIHPSEQGWNAVAAKIEAGIRGGGSPLGMTGRSTRRPGAAASGKRTSVRPSRSAKK
ncbi:MAG: hypothetical protein M3P29_06380 [Acidobacteriota bacterium]|nr:hypothetical protein [Acidobacteriota bacterium]